MANEKTDNELLTEINDRLNEVIGLLSIQGKPEAEQIRILDALGFDSNKIGMFLGMSGVAVRKRKMKARRQKARK
jgi:hypothetical protein